jgi:DNA-binding beta-propeller fold protein YncE
LTLSEQLAGYGQDNVFRGSPWAMSIEGQVMRSVYGMRSNSAVANWKAAMRWGIGWLLLVGLGAATGQRIDELPTGKALTPAAAAGSTFQYLNPHNPLAPDLTVNGAAAVAVSPDGSWLAIMTSGYNTFADPSGGFPPGLSTEYLFVFEIRETTPRQVQAFPIRTTLQGLSWAPSSRQLYVSGGTDDAVLEFTWDGGAFKVGRTFCLGHKKWVGGPPDALGGKGCGCAVSAVSVSPDGRRLLVANYMNDSVSLLDLGSGRMIAEQDLRPGVIDRTHRGRAGGSYPRAVAWISGSRAYAASERDREVIALSVGSASVAVASRTKVPGQPVALTANRSGSRLYVALDTSSQVGVIDTRHNNLIELIDVVAPPALFQNKKRLGGANTNAVTLTPDERILLISNGGENAIAVVKLGDRAAGPTDDHAKKVDRADREDESDDVSRVVGLIPTGWYPAGAATSKDGKTWFVVNGKSPTGPNISWCTEADRSRATCLPDKHAHTRYNSRITFAENDHIEQLEKGGFLTLPAPSPLELARLTKLVAHNNHMDEPDKTRGDEQTFLFLRDHIKHVIYIMKENRSYDQILGDLAGANGDPRLTLFPEKITPNHHAIARNFVTLDNTLVSGEGSIQGFMWTYSGQTNDHNERVEPLGYVGRASIDGYGSNRGINMGLATSEERHAQYASSPVDADILPGTHDVNAPDGPDGMGGLGTLWDLALRSKLSIRNYGLSPDPHNDLGGYDCVDHCQAQPLVHDAFHEGVRVYWPSKASLVPFSDPYFRPFMPAYPDFWRVKEWKREFDEFSRRGSLPNLMTMWLGNDHIGWFGQAIDGVNTPETQMADNDYALGIVLEAVAHSPFAKDTLVISIEDDAWDGWDHVEAHRTVALFAGPYVRQHAVVSTRYTTVNVLKTVEEILGIEPIGLNDALAFPMSDVFDSNAATWSYEAIVPDVLRSTELPLPAGDHVSTSVPAHSARYWTRLMSGQDFSGPDRINPATFNRALWRGVKRGMAFPGSSVRRDRRLNEGPGR